MNKKSSCWDCWGWWVSFPKGGRFGKAIGPAVKTIPPFPIAAGCLCSGTACLNSAGLRLLQVKHFYNSHTGTKTKRSSAKGLFGILIGLTGLVLRGIVFNLHPWQRKQHEAMKRNNHWNTLWTLPIVALKASKSSSAWEWEAATILSVLAFPGCWPQQIIQRQMISSRYLLNSKFQRFGYFGRFGMHKWFYANSLP